MKTVELGINIANPLGCAYFWKAKGNILYVMHIDVLSTKIGIFWKNFALKFVTPQKFENKFWNFLKPTNDQASQLLLYNELSMPGSKILELIFLRKKIMKNFMKKFMKNFWDLPEKCFIETVESHNINKWHNINGQTYWYYESMTKVLWKHGQFGCLSQYQCWYYEKWII